MFINIKYKFTSLKHSTLAMLLLFFCFVQCKKEKKYSDENDIVKLTINDGSESLEANINTELAIVTFNSKISYQVSKAVIKNIELSDKASADKNNGDSLSFGTSKINVTAQNGKVKPYTITIEREVEPVTNSIPTVQTNGIGHVTYTGAEISGSVLDIGDSTVIAYGYICGLTEEVTITGNFVAKKNFGSTKTPSSFFASIIGLSPNTNYFAKTYATNDAGTGYGEVKSFTTPRYETPNFGIVTSGGLQTRIETKTITGTYFQTLAHSKIDKYGTGKIIQHGHVYSSVVENDKLVLNENDVLITELGSKSLPEKDFTSVLTNLINYEVYYIRPYVIDDLSGVFYGRQLTFITPAGAPYTTIGNITPRLNSASISGAIPHLVGNNTSSISFGVIWSTTSGNLTTALPTKTIQSNINQSLTFESNAINLEKNTTYYVRTYASNGGAVGYSEIKSFKTLNDETDILSLHIEASVSGNVLYSQTKTIEDLVSGNSLVYTGVPYEVTKATIKSIGLSDQASSSINNIVSITGGSTLSIGSNNITVEASHGNTKEYTISLNYSPSVIPELTTIAAKFTTFNATILKGELTNIGAPSLSELGYIYSSTISGENLVLGNEGVSKIYNTEGSNGVFSIQLTGLSSNTLYYVKAYAINEAGTGYGNQISFSTREYTLPVVSTLSASSILYNSATLDGKINSTGNTAVTQHGFIYSKEVSGSGLIIGNSDVSITANLGGNQGAFNRVINGLSSNSTYYYKAYAINTAGTAYGEEINFSTRERSLPEIITLSATNISFSTTTLNGNITSLGADSLIQHGFVYSDSVSGDELEIGNSGVMTVPDTEGSLGEFSLNVSELSSNTLYYVKAYAINIVGTSYGNQLSFFTGTYTYPEVSTLSSSNITFTTATLNGNIESTGNTPLTQHGFVYSATISGEGLKVGNSDISITFNSGGNVGMFNKNINELSSNTIYYVRAYARNTAGMVYGEEVSLSTEPFSLPEVKTLTGSNIENISYTSVTLNGFVTNAGADTLIERGFVYSATANGDDLTIGNTDVTTNTYAGGGKGLFTRNISGLSSNTTYYVRSYATNLIGTSYGNEITFTTLTYNLPVVSTITPNNITFSSATLIGEITDLGNPFASQHGFIYSASVSGTNLEFGNSNVSTITTVGGVIGTYNNSISGLSSNTTYYVRAFVSNEGGTAYGVEVSFTTLEFTIPEVTTLEVSSVSFTTATLNGTITNLGDVSLTRHGFVYSATISGEDSLVYGNDGVTTILNSGGALGSFSNNISGLTSNTTYYVRAYATNNTGINHGDVLSFTTTAYSPPIINTLTASSITINSAVLNGEVTSVGNTAINEYGFIYSTNSDFAVNLNGIGNQKISVGTNIGVESFDRTITGLTSNTTYYVRAFATNTAGTSYGAEQIFKTNTQPPIVNTLSVTSVNITTATLNGQITTIGNPEATQRGFVYSNSVSGANLISGSSGVIITYVAGIDVNVFSSSVNGLSSNSTYYIRAFATNTEGTVYGSEETFMTNAQPPSINTLSASSIGITIATVNGQITNLGNPLATQRGFVYSNSVSGDNLQSGNTGVNEVFVTGIDLNTFESNLTGLSSNDIYYVKAFVVNTNGTVYGTQRSFMTLQQPPSVNTLNTTHITVNSADLNGQITNLGNPQVTQRGFVYSNSVSGTNLQSGITGVSEVIVTGIDLNIFLIHVIGLSSNSTYYARAFVTSSEGNVYGNEISFTTIPHPPTVNTLSATNISITTATLNGQVTDLGIPEATQRGFVYSDLISGDNLVVGFSGVTTAIVTGELDLNEFNRNINGLTSNQTYYVRAYATYVGGTRYGEQRIFTTNAQPPTVVTLNTTNIAESTATLNGQITDIGNPAATERGFIYSNVVSGTNLTLGSGGVISVSISGTDLNAYASNITGLSSNDTYYVRAYAIHSTGTIYGIERSFTTESHEPMVNTSSATNVLVTTATLNGQVTDLGNPEVTERGFIYSNTVSGANLISGSSGVTLTVVTGIDLNTFNTSLTGLNSNSIYYFRAFARNTNGFVYGTELNFTTNALELPDVVFSSSGNTLSGTITNIGSSDVTSFGFVWSISGAGVPTLTNNSGSFDFTQNINASGHNFTHTLTGGIFSIRSYATNSEGTAYSAIDSFIAFIHIPDDNFRGALIPLVDSNAVRGTSIRQDALEGITGTLNINNLAINDLTGIDYLTSISTLSAVANPFTIANLSNNSALEFIFMQYNPNLASITTSNNTVLQQLGAFNCSLTFLDLSKSVNLQFIQVYQNSLSNIDVSKNTATTHLSVQNNSLTNIDLSNNTLLTSLAVNNNSLSSLDVSGLTQLSSLFSNNNSFTYIDVSSLSLTNFSINNNPSLTYLDTHSNSLTNIDIRTNTQLAYLDLGMNLYSSVNVGYNTSLTYLDVGNNSLNSIDLSGNDLLVYLDINSNTLSNIDLSNTSSLTHLNISDNSFSSIDLSINTILTYLNIDNNSITNLDLSNISTLTYLNVNDNTSLTYLEANNKMLSVVELSGGSSLTNIRLADNSLTYIDIEGSTTLDYLAVNNNSLTEIDLSSNTSLTHLLIGGNSLTALDISSNTLLDYLAINNDASLTYLDLSSITSLTYLNANDNTALEYLQAAGHSLVDLEINNNVSLTSLLAFNNNFGNLDISGNGSLGYISIGNSNLTQINIDENTSLTYLKIDSNSLTYLNTSTNTALREIIIHRNDMRSLDLSGNNLINSVTSWSNSLTSVFVDNATSLTFMNLGSNSITGIDLSDNTALKRLHLDTNALTSLDISNNTSLTRLTVNNNTALFCIQIASGQYINTVISGAGQYFHTNCSVPPMVSTNSAQSIMANSATIRGQVTHLGHPPATARGFVYSSSVSGANLTIGSANVTNIPVSGINTNEFTNGLSGLSSNTTYYVRAYATNAGGTNYGNMNPFTTLATTGKDVTGITITSVSGVTYTGVTSTVSGENLITFSLHAGVTGGSIASISLSPNATSNRNVGDVLLTSNTGATIIVTAQDGSTKTYRFVLNSTFGSVNTSNNVTLNWPISPRGFWGNGTNQLYAAAQGAGSIANFSYPGGIIDIFNSKPTITENADYEDLWSDGVHLWLVDSADNKIYAYSIAAANVPSEEFNALSGSSPIGLWSNGTTMWVSDNSDNKIYAYNMNTKARDTSQEFDSIPNGSRCLWSDGTTMWVSNSDGNIYAYNLSTKARDTSKDITSLDSANNDPYGMWSDGEFMFVNNLGGTTLYAYIIN